MNKPYIRPEIEIHYFTTGRLIEMVQSETNEQPEYKVAMVPEERWLDGLP